MIKPLSIFLILFLLGCQEEEYNIEYLVENNSPRNVYINYQNYGSSTIDTNLISGGQTLIFLIEMGSGKNSCDYMDGISELPFTMIDVHDIDGNKLKCDVSELDCWIEGCNPDKNGIGSFRLRVRDFDFEQ